MSPSGAVAAVNSFAPDGLASRKQDNLWTHYAFDPQGSVVQLLSSPGAVLLSSVNARGAVRLRNSGLIPQFLRRHAQIRPFRSHDPLESGEGAEDGSAPRRTTENSSGPLLKHNFKNALQWKRVLGGRGRRTTSVPPLVGGTTDHGAGLLAPQRDSRASRGERRLRAGERLVESADPAMKALWTQAAEIDKRRDPVTLKVYSLTNRTM